MNQELKKKQQELAKQIDIPLGKEGYMPQKNDIVLALDIQYDDDKACVAGDVLYWQGEHIGTFAGVSKAGNEYVSGYFCFREGPPLLHFLNHLNRYKSINPALIIVDGHGIAHPRRFGVACWLGLAANIPCIGSAKKSLLKYTGELAVQQGSVLPVYLAEEVVGYVVRTQEGVRPVFVSPGHQMSIENSLKVIEHLAGDFRIPDMLRRADQSARALQRKDISMDWEDLGSIAEYSLPI